MSEKFFALCAIFGAENVGMLTGDASVNSGAPIIACTAEVLANIALREGAEADIGQVVMDEFHFYAEPQRGWAWQVPILDAAPGAVPADVGDARATCASLREDLTRRTGRETALVDDAERPVPLDFSWSVEPLHELLEQLVRADQAPAYVVHFTQASALSTAQSLLSAKLCTREERDAIADAIGAFRFTAGFGKTLSKLVRAGIGVHHAGMLPRYRRLVEQLAQTGLLKVICGTDTLGVGINVPIRTVVFTGLAKFDGTNHRLLKAREFHQIAGRAGRAGFDTAGYVVVQAPEHTIENARRVAKAARRREEGQARAEGQAGRRRGELDRGDLHAAARRATPEALVSRMRVNHAMILNLINQRRDPDAHAARAARGQPRGRARPPAARRAGRVAAGGAAGLGRARAPGAARRVRPHAAARARAAAGLRLEPAAGVVRAGRVRPDRPGVRDLRAGRAVGRRVDPRRPVPGADGAGQQGARRRRGVDEGRRHRVRGADGAARGGHLPEAAGRAAASRRCALYRETHPWVSENDLSPKSVVRDMYEWGRTFTEFVAFYGVTRSEGLVLRYLSDTYRALRQTVPERHGTDELDDIIEWLGELVRQVDSSLLDEWEALTDPESVARAAEAAAAGVVLAPPRPITANERAFGVMVRNAMFQKVQLAARDAWGSLAALEGEGKVAMPAHAGRRRSGAYWDEYETLDDGPAARSPALLLIDRSSPRLWTVRQIIDDPEGHHDWAIVATVDLDASDAAGEPVIRTQSFSAG